MEVKIAVIGLGYVGLPVALAFARNFDGVVGFDVHQEKVAELRGGYDRNGEVSCDVLTKSTLRFSSDPADLVGASFFVVAVPTPVDPNNVPDLTPLIRASETPPRRDRQREECARLDTAAEIDSLLESLTSACVA